MQGWYPTDLDAWVGERIAVSRDEYTAVALATWQLAIVFYLVGDTTGTAIVLSLGGFEASPVARAFVDVLGYPGLVAQKILVFALLAALWRYYPAIGVDSPDPWRLIVPAIPLLRGVQLVAIHVSNAVVLL